MRCALEQQWTADGPLGPCTWESFLDSSFPGDAPAGFATSPFFLSFPLHSCICVCTLPCGTPMRPGFVDEQVLAPMAESVTSPQEAINIKHEFLSEARSLLHVKHPYVMWTGYACEGHQSRGCTPSHAALLAFEPAGMC